MTTDRERCAPKIVGEAAEVEKLLQRYARPKPERHEVPTEPGVYRGYRAEVDLEIHVQLDETGQWWPWPYSFSGWRTSEISLFELTPLPDHHPDVPAVRNPELRETVDTLTEDLFLAFPEIGDVERAHKFALDQLKDQY